MADSPMDEQLTSLAALLQKRMDSFEAQLCGTDSDQTPPAASQAAVATTDADAEGMLAYDSAVEQVWSDTVRSLTHDAEYWARLNSAAFDGECDSIDAIAESFESAYVRSKEKRGRLPRPVARVQRNAEQVEAIGSDPRGMGRESSPQEAAAAVRPELLAQLGSFDPAAVLAAVSRFDAGLRVQLGKAPFIPVLPEADLRAVLAAFEHMLSTFHADEPLRRRFGFRAGELGPLPIGGNVPSYFANVEGHSIFARKTLSIAGLRNLVLHGRSIYLQLERKHFISDPAAYPADTGLTLMRRVTGNVVDLDTTVLRCSDSATLNVINMCNLHKGLRAFASASEFSASAQAEEIAVHSATIALEDFATKLKITTPAAQNARKIAVGQIKRPVPIARSNTERGHTPLWHYVNAGQDSFHANVPSMDDVVGALLRAPLHAAKHWAAIHSGAFGDAPAGKAARARIDAFFEDCIVDACFNQKWRAVETFGEQLEHEGSIVDVLQRLQMANQHCFPAALFETDSDARENEIAAMARLAVGQLARDPATKRLRPITLRDIEGWARSS